MDLNSINVFILTHQLGSFAAVAKQINVAPSSISRMIANLEQELNTRLFNRSTRKLTLTLAGENYYESVRPLIAEMDALHQQLSEETSSPSGKLVISASVSFGQIVLAPLLTSFCEQYPRITLDLKLSDSRIDMLSTQVDLAIRHGKMQDSSLIARKLCNINYSLVASQNYLQHKSPICHPNDVIAHQIVTFGYEAFNHFWYFQSQQSRLKLAINPKLTLSNALGIRECVKNDFGVALLPDWAISQDIKVGHLVRLLPDWQVTGLDSEPGIWLVQPSRHFIPDRVRVFTEFLFENIATITF